MGNADFIAAALAAVLIADMTFLGTATAFIRDGRMAYGLKAGSVSIGGMTREEAAREIQRIARTALNGEALILSLPDENHAFSFSAEEIGLSVDTDKMLDAVKVSPLDFRRLLIVIGMYDVNDLLRYICAGLVGLFCVLHGKAEDHYHHGSSQRCCQNSHPCLLPSGPFHTVFLPILPFNHVILQKRAGIVKYAGYVRLLRRQPVKTDDAVFLLNHQRPVVIPDHSRRE